MVTLSDSQSGGIGFESRAGHLLDFVLGRPDREFKSSATLVNSQLVAASCQLAFLILLCSIWVICF